MGYPRVWALPVGGMLPVAVTTVRTLNFEVVCEKAQVGHLGWAELTANWLDGGCSRLGSIPGVLSARMGLSEVRGAIMPLSLACEPLSRTTSQTYDDLNMASPVLWYCPRLTRGLYGLDCTVVLSHSGWQASRCLCVRSFLLGWGGCGGGILLVFGDRKGSAGRTEECSDGAA